MTGVTKALEAEPAYRTTERLVALLRYELTNPNGVGPSELLEDLLEFARDRLLNDSMPEGRDPADAEMEQVDENARVMTEAIVRALIAVGDVEAVECFIEGAAAIRAQCEAKFETPRTSPFLAEEQAQLVAEWDRSDAEYRAAQAAELVAGAGAS